MSSKDNEGQEAGGFSAIGFRVGDEEYGLRLTAVREIVTTPHITRVPKAADHIKGVINLRGEVMPVIDLSFRFFGVKSEISRRTCIVIIELLDDELVHIGVMIDAVNAVVDISSDQVEPALGFSAKIRADFIHGIAKVDRDFIILLNLYHALDIEELSNFDNQIESQAIMISNGSNTVE